MINPLDLALVYLSCAVTWTLVFIEELVVKKIAVSLAVLTLPLSLAFTANAAEVIGLKYNSTTSKNEIYSVDTVSGTTTLLKEFTFSSGEQVYNGSNADVLNGKIIIHGSSGGEVIYDIANNTVSENTVTTMYIVPTATSGGTESLVSGSSSTSAIYINSSANTVTINSGSSLIVDGVNITDTISNGDASTLASAKSYASGLAAMNMASSSISLSLGGRDGFGVGTGYVDGHSAIALGGAKSLSDSLRVSFNGSYNNTVKKGAFGAGVSWGF